jgi:hypothetical protein
MRLKYLQWQFHRNDVKPWLLKSPTNVGLAMGWVRNRERINSPDTRNTYAVEEFGLTND